MSWNQYYEAAELKENLQRELGKRRQRGEKLDAFAAPTGKKLTHEFWGAAWARHLETYCGYDQRLGRGRAYLRQGKVLNLTVAPGRVAAEVAGSYLYEVEVRVSPLPDASWRKIKKACAGQVGSLLDLLGGKLGDGVMKIITDPDKGLFPHRQEIRHHCTCPDHADLCKHQAAVLYAIAVQFDQDPKVFFELRGVDPSELIASGATSLTESVANASGELAGADLSALFGIDLAEPEVEPPPVKKKTVVRKKKSRD